ncbi:MAG: hypothetical protein JW840_04485, partial [Candidatus Thermoplasmatota archaeon]|nr:hypothetical protein [Candidatus Thermoplasmatota archaeon]
MKKFIPILLVGILVLGGLGAAAFSTNVSNIQDQNIQTETTSVLFASQPTQTQKDSFVEIHFDGATTQLLEPNRPILPLYVKTYQIPFRSTNIEVACTPNDIGSMKLTDEIVPARIAPRSQLAERTAYVKDPVVYEATALYPDAWFTYDLGAGRNENNVQVTFVKVVCYPVRYSPLQNEITYAGGFDIQLSYTEPQAPQAASAADDYDLVIIAPAKFQAALEPLVTHKNTKGVSTLFKSVEDILAE